MSNRVVVTGIGLKTPVGLDRGKTWDALLKGTSGIDKISSFDAEEFEIFPKLFLIHICDSFCSEEEL